MVDNKNAFLSTNIKGMMMTLLADWNEQMDIARSGTEFAAISPSDMRAFGQLRGRTMPLTQLHRELSISRQAAQKTVSRLAKQGLLKVELAPGNHRDKILKITQKGQRWRKLAAQEIKKIEDGCAEAIGERRKETLRKLLVELVENIDHT